MQKFNRVVLQVEVFDEVFNLKKPNGCRVQKWLRDLDILNEQENPEVNADIELAADLLEDAGMPREKFLDMYQDDQLSLTTLLITAGQEKK